MHLIGAEMNTNSEIADHFHGFMWQFCIYTYAKHDFSDDITTDLDCGSPYCTNCPFTPDKCLIDCEKNEYVDGDTCAPCDPACEEGCVRGGDCNPCYDELCSVCPEWDVCEQCIDNASGTPCECDNGYYQNGILCIQCDSQCAVCSGPGNHACTECEDGSFLQPDSTSCQRRCPTGYTENSDTNTCDGDGGQAICFTYDNVFLTDWIDSENDVNAVGGTLAATSDDSDPTVIFDRGIWFDGNDYQTITPFAINFEYAIQVWARPRLATGTLFSIGIPDASNAEEAILLTLALHETN